MTKVMRHEEKERRHAAEAGKIVPFRSALNELPHWMERIDDLLMERWAPFWPMLRFPEEVALKVPPVDVYEEGEEVVLKAELPGLKKEEITVAATEATITISGRKVKEEKVERKDYHRTERAAGEFSRTVRLPAEIDLEKVTAAYRDGVLEVRAHRAAGARPITRKVEIE